MKYFSDITGIGYSTLSRYTRDSIVFIDNYLFSRELIVTEIVKRTDLIAIKNMIEIYQKRRGQNFNKNSSGKSPRVFSGKSHKFTLTNTKTNMSHIFPTLDSTVYYSRQNGTLLAAYRLSKIYHGSTLKYAEWIIFKH